MNASSRQGFAARSGPGLAQRVLILVWDGLRPDSIDEGVMPNLWALAQGGVYFANSHATYPTETRVNSATLASGSQPGRHGLVGNTLFVPQLDPAKGVVTADHHILLEIDRLTKGNLLQVETLGERVASVGGRLAVASSGSPGSAFLQNHRLNGPIINPRLILPESLAAQVEELLGPSPPDAVPNTARNEYVTDAFTHYILPQVSPMVGVLWLSEPDYTQHPYGLGSPEALRALRENDARLGRVSVALEDLGTKDTTDIFLLSDHGFSTITGSIDLTQRLIEAGLKRGVDSHDVVAAANGVFVQDGGQGRSDQIVAFLQQQEWAGPIFTKGVNPVPGTLPMSLLWGGRDNDRSPDVGFSFNWAEAANEHGVMGTSVSEGHNRASHGTCSPFDLHNTLIAAGPDFKGGLVSRVPAGLVDIAPTILAILGIERPEAWDGRVLHEALVGGPDPSRVAVERGRFEASTSVGGMRFQQAIEVSRVESSSYLEAGWVKRG